MLLIKEPAAGRLLKRLFRKSFLCCGEEKKSSTFNVFPATWQRSLGSRYTGSSRDGKRRYSSNRASRKQASTSPTYDKSWKIALPSVEFLSARPSSRKSPVWCFSTIRLTISHWKQW